MALVFSYLLLEEFKGEKVRMNPCIFEDCDLFFSKRWKVKVITTELLNIVVIPFNMLMDETSSS
jgi:hypothetical protein